jgi:hypothetical protein
MLIKSRIIALSVASMFRKTMLTSPDAAPSATGSTSELSDEPAPPEGPTPLPVYE